MSHRPVESASRLPNCQRVPSHSPENVPRLRTQSAAPAQSDPARKSLGSGPGLPPKPDRRAPIDLSGFGIDPQAHVNGHQGHQAAFVSRRTPLNFFGLFLTAINLPSVLSRFVQAVFPIIFPLSWLRCFTAPMRRLSPVGSLLAMSFPLTVMRVVQRYLDLLRSWPVLALLCHFETLAVHSGLRPPVGLLTLHAGRPSNSYASP